MRPRTHRPKADGDGGGRMANMPRPTHSTLFEALQLFRTNYLKISALKHLRSLTHPSGSDAPKPLHHFERLLSERDAKTSSIQNFNCDLTFSTMMIIEFRIMIHPEQGRICSLCQQGGKVRYSFRYVIVVAWHFPRTFNCCCIVEYIKNDVTFADLSRVCELLQRKQIKKLDGSEFRNAFDRQSVRVGQGHGEKSTLEMGMKGNKLSELHWHLLFWFFFDKLTCSLFAVRCTNMGKPRQGKAGILLWMRRDLLRVSLDLVLVLSAYSVGSSNKNIISMLVGC
ncbi:hypothetical protein DVH24_010875 [Malus domestica]|uniref:Uncharacterized protein n=1 Tax=Malus domestica TaxID=3750 RepID=A0A498JSZ3_MALDO|nr:hypothetical protein DVH24_010875 [Malus domestica]